MVKWQAVPSVWQWARGARRSRPHLAAATIMMLSSKNRRKRPEPGVHAQGYLLP